MVSSYIGGLRQQISNLPNGKRFKARVDFMDHVCQSLANKELPKYHFPHFQLSKKEVSSYLSSLIELGQPEFEKVVLDLQKFDHDLREFRTYLQVRFGYWATITSDLMKTWSELYPNKIYLELMAGNGYISKGFMDNGIKSICTDDLSWSKQSQTGLNTLVNVENLDAIAALNKYSQSVDAVVLAWSPDREEIDYDILQLVRQFDLELFVIGEKNGATNSRKFWESAQVLDSPEVEKLNELYKQYDLVSDKIYLIN
ncbi:hypothetical protein [Companilactobacillus baiquanensis]|uniref:SAM-dependent methyltransferase n=1 Tax=Companilactobacillus baiquanensis TaxID=2486005 RepID=A0ABW1UWY6_9LACO|nr:hypothetical protein [Companilactobacillus baiquanensis]